MIARPAVAPNASARTAVTAGPVRERRGAIVMTPRAPYRSCRRSVLQARFLRPQGSLGAVLRAKLAADAPDMELDRDFLKLQSPRDLLVGPSFLKILEYLALPLSQWRMAVAVGGVAGRGIDRAERYEL